ncbi:chromosome segregation and condensation protein ScpA [Leptospira ryugenii]|uniref:Segregation and condensation protein A n=1 Tax=Leptospira ryugenii TaxID=1917863 RepID=A0A2P2DYY2_9LEPT|nr:segregation/condensation protein A [Leptospira ryugenii]GBF49838.1 chromosome segregation and condensation protein ScpA [Leptospira ryugenii]
MSQTPEFIVRWNNQDGGLTEGPLSVLWSLIDSYKVDIFEVSLARITSDFIQFLRTSQSLSIELSSEFALMAAHLVYLKSKALLPDPGFEEEDIEPPLPKELVDKLLEHKKFQMAGQRLAELDRITAGMFTRETNQVLEEEDSWLDVSLVDLISAFNSILEKEAANSGEEDIPIYEGHQQYSVEDKMAFLHRILDEKGELHFLDLFTQYPPEKKEIVAGFIAVLETVKIRVCKVVQHQLFGEIKIVKVA